ncbi:putative isomerase YraM like protein [Verticillium longisporum]|nr:putative isomerase YraM like protein [Verticillium longisporum]
MTITPTSSSARRTRRSLPAVLMRAGTSKGLFIHRAHLPPSENAWAAPLLAAMGSRYNDTRQIDGIGGATSVTSKVAVVAPSSRPGVDVDYTFVQVAVGKETIDMSGNCGNMCSGVGPFAVQEKLVEPQPGARTVDVRIFNTNTSRTIVETVQIDENGELKEDGNCIIPGVRGSGSEIKVAFVDPAGSMTNKLFPSGVRAEKIVVDEVAGLSPFSVDVTLIDSANPFILVDAQTTAPLLKGQQQDSPLSITVTEAIRQHGAVLMGLVPDLEAAAMVRGTPKIAYVSRPDPSTCSPSDIQVLAYSMGKPHPSLQLTGAVCIASAVCMEGTVANSVARGQKLGESEALTPERTPSPPRTATRDIQELEQRADLLAPGLSSYSTQVVTITHGSGSMEVEVWTKLGPCGLEIDRCIVSRTARRLFEGKVLYYV